MLRFDAHKTSDSLYSIRFEACTHFIANVRLCRQDAEQAQQHPGRINAPWVLLLSCSEWINQSPEAEAAALASSRPFLRVSAHFVKTLPNSNLLVELLAR